MALTYDDVLIIRQWVGNEYEENDIYSEYDLQGTVDLTIIAILRKQLAEAITQPVSVIVPGLTITWGNRAQMLKDRLDTFIAEGGTDGLPEEVPGVPNIKQFVRADYR